MLSAFKGTVDELSDGSIKTYADWQQWQKDVRARNAQQMAQDTPTPDRPIMEPRRLAPTTVTVPRPSADAPTGGTPGGTATVPASTDPIDRLASLFTSAFGQTGGGGGGISASAVPIDTGSGSGGTSLVMILGIVGVVGYGVYYYIKHRGGGA